MSQHVHKVSIKDYRPPQFEVLNIRLNIDIRLGVTQVTQTSVWRRLGQETKALVLNGKNLKLLSLKVNGQPHEDVKVHENGLSIESLGAEFILEIVTEIYPEKNFSCEGLYYSGKTYLTQCEAEDFRRITYFLDRPDVLTFYEVRIEADRAKNPILLSNGHLVKEEDLGNGRHAAIWKDPFKKPCYLFAMVAGDMGCLEDQYETLTGRKILLKIYSPHGTQHLCHFAMQSLKRSMRWDEETFGLEYDLDLYMIVVTDDFNGGAMENKGLNIFHTRYVFADQKIATDAAFIGVESVIAHEYFHNYSGNRVTCQNWFHLSLKEGLTVFRDQEFSADMWNRGVIRQTQVRGLIERQFAEDGGPNAHPVRPTEVASYNNLYTSTIYEKGAEVIRMIQYWLGKKEFTKGVKHYFSKHDGQAVRIDDFVQAVFEVNNVKDYQQFMQWYDAAGTPKINVKETFTAATGELEIELQQEIPQVRNHQAMHPFHIPIHIGFLDPAGKEVACDGADQFRNSDQQMILHLKHSQQKWKFQFPQLKETRGPVISYLRGFCAPVYFHGNQSRDQRLHLALNDSDLFNRIWALQSLYIEDIIAHYQSGSNVYQLDSEIKNCLQRTLLNPQLDAAIKAGMMTMPPLSLILEKLTDVDVNKLANVLTLCEKEIGIALTGELDELYRKLWEGDRKALDAKSISERALKDRCLALLATTESRVAQKYVLQQFAHARHFNDEYTALEVAMNFDWNETLTMSEDFIRKHHEQYLTRLSWFGLVAQSNRKDTLTLVQQAAGSPYFDRKNPAASLKLLRLYGENFFQSYRNNCEGLLYVLDGIVQMDQFNSLAAARHCSVFDYVGKIPKESKLALHKRVQQLESAGKISEQVLELLPDED